MKSFENYSSIGDTKLIELQYKYLWWLNIAIVSFPRVGKSLKQEIVEITVKITAAATAITNAAQSHHN